MRSMREKFKYQYMDEFLYPGSGKIAIISDDKDYSYYVLTGRIDQLTGFILNSVNYKDGGIVMLFFDKSFEYIVSIYSVLKAGMAYMPVDVALPPEKIQYYMDMAKPVMILTDDANYRKIQKIIEQPASSNIPINRINCPDDGLTVDDTPVQKDRLPEEYHKSDSLRNPDSLAYVIFTSGSSGKPKGVMITHRSICTFLSYVMEMGLYNERTRYLNICPFHFDASLTDLFCIMASGGTLVLMKKMVLPSLIYHYLKKYEITDTLLISTVLKIFQTYSESLAAPTLPFLKTIWYGGESCNVDTVRKVKAIYPQLKFIHGYGPTETSHSATLLVFDTIDESYQDYMPLGRILPTIYSYVLNTNMEPVPDGETGELYIGGVQVMKGYINDPERTESVLPDDPYQPGKKIYKTGDLVLKDSHGYYRYKGRTDDLVKVAGNLVSLCELENTIMKNPMVRDTIVLKMSDPLLTNKILAFIVKKDSSLTEQDLDIFLKQRLSYYTIPSEFIFIGENDLKLTNNGKIDKAAIQSLYGDKKTKEMNADGY
jgi:amino acid adenylation domain-containing protein